MKTEAPQTKELRLLEKLLAETPAGGRRGKTFRRLLYEMLLAQSGKGNPAAARALTRLRDKEAVVAAVYKEAYRPTKFQEYIKSGVFFVPTGFSVPEAYRWVDGEMSKEEEAEIRARPITHPVFENIYWPGKAPP